LWQRGTVIIDLALLWMLWPSVARGKVTWIAWRDLRHGIAAPVALIRLLSALRPRTAPANARWIAWRVLRPVTRRATVATAAASLMLVLLVFMIATFPGEWLDQEMQSVPIIRLLNQLLFVGAPDEVSGGPRSWFSNRLVLTDQSFVDPDKLDKAEVSHSFRGRNLSYAVLNRADLRKQTSRAQD
jgi:hypothetical protein